MKPSTTSTSRSRRVWALVGISALCVLLAAAGWVGVRGYFAQLELRAAIPLAGTLKHELLTGDTEQAATTGRRLAERSGAAAGLTGDPIWRAAEIVPWVGANLTVMREISMIVDDIARDAIVPLVDVAASVDLAELKPVDGRLDLAPLVAAQPRLRSAAAAIGHGADRAARIDSSRVIEPLRDAHEHLESTFADVTGAVDALDRAVNLLPSMLGAHEPRNTLLLFQNNAELRASGGIPGALALLHADNGAISLPRQASSSDFPPFDEPVVDLPLETEAMYGRITGRFVQDVNLTPKFPLAASIAREMWQRKSGEPIDSVISIDPVALSYLLVATGPVTLPTGDTLTSENAVSLLLSDVYNRYPEPREQDAFFASAAGAVFETVARGDVDPAGFITALARAGEERRILVWSERDEEQALLAGTALAGELPVETADTHPIGAYFNDATGAKMGLYLDVAFGTATLQCRADGRPEYILQLTLTNDAPVDAASVLPRYVTGGGNFGTAEGNIRTNVMVYGPPGAYNLGVLRDGQPTAYQPTIDSGYTVSFLQVELAPGESATYEFRYLGEDARPKSLIIEHTPFVYNPETLELDVSCQSALS